MKKFAALLLSLVMCFLLFACAPDADVADKDEFLGLEDGEEFTTDKEITVTFIRPSGNPAQNAWWTASIDAFNEAYKGRIKVVPETLVRGDNSTYEQQIGLRNEDGYPDVMYVDGPYVSNWAYSGTIQPIDNYLTKTYLSDFMDYVIDQGTYDGRLYTLSIVDSTIMVFYRKSIMNDFLKTNPVFEDGTSIKLPAAVEEAWTFEQLAEIAVKLTKNGTPKRYGLSIAGDQTEWMSYAFSPMWGKNILGEDNLTAADNVNSVKGIRAGNYLKGLVADGAINPKANNKDFYFDGEDDNTEAQPLRAAMYFTGTQNITEFNKYENVKSDWAATYYPKVRGEDYAVPCGGWTLAMSRDCATERRLAAVEFIKYLTSKESCRTFAHETASPPARKSLYDTMDEYKSGSTVQDGSYLKIKEQILAAATPRVKTVAYAEFTPLLAGALNDIVQTSSTDVSERLTKAATQIDNKIKTAKYKK